jgi:hypothetical protein
MEAAIWIEEQARTWTCTLSVIRPEELGGPEGAM